MRLPYEFVQDELKMCEGWALYAWCIENDGWLKFCKVERKSPGYVKQQIDKMISELDYAKG